MENERITILYGKITRKFVRAPMARKLILCLTMMIEVCYREHETVEIPLKAPAGEYELAILVREGTGIEIRELTLY